MNIARMWLSKTSVIQRVISLLYWLVRNNQHRLEKVIQLGSGAEIFLKNFSKIYKFWSLGLEFQVLNLWIFDEVSVLKF